MRRVLFVYTGNTCRSVIAEYLGRRFCGEVFTFESAGIRPQTAVEASNAVFILRNTFGIDASAHQPRDVRRLDLTTFDAIIAIENNAADRRPGTGRARGEADRVADSGSMGRRSHRVRASGARYSEETGQADTGGIAMTSDRYLKTVLTAIAGCLIYMQSA